MNIARFEVPYLPAFLLLASGLLIRIAAQGLEQGLISTMIEFSTDRLKAGSRKAFSSFRNLLATSDEA